MKASVCIITHNHEKFIEQAVQGVLEQDVNFEYEIVVGEDCSTDRTASILKQLESKNQKRLRVIYRSANVGVNANLLNTLAACNGEYVAFLDGDDYWTSTNKLQQQVDFLNNNRGTPGVFHRTRVINFELLSEYGLGPVLPPVDPPEFFSLGFLLRNLISFSVSSLLARRAYFRNIDTWLAGVRPVDWPLYVMLATQGDLGFIPLEMSVYRVHAAGNWSRLSQYHRVALGVRMLMRVMGLVSGKDQELVESVKSSIANWWSAELVTNTSVSIEAVTKELNQIADSQLSNYLLAQVVAVARAKGEAEQAETTNLKSAIKAAETQIAILCSSLQAEGAQTADFLGHIQQLEIKLAALSHYRGMFGALREIGDRVTGGGLRNLAKRIRASGDRITGGGLRKPSQRAVTTALRKR
jgi:glycosyltransferase involved in cell wall biosynthesis